MPYKDPKKKAEFQKRYGLNGYSAAAMKRWRENPENRDKERRRLRDYNRYRKDRQIFLVQRRLRAHGVTQKEYEDKVSSQNNLCAVCFKEMESPNIDHNHKTGKRRDLLCRHCNTLLGMCFEDTKILQSAVNYLNRHSE